MTDCNLNTERVPLILVVDDDRTMRSLLNLAMEEEGYRVIEAKNGRQCLAEYTNFHPDLILLDAVMPDLDGFTCCEKIRSLPGGTRVPIVMITVLDNRESVEQAFKAGATDYITKPIHWEVLSQRVSRLLTLDRSGLEVKAIREQLSQQQAWEKLIRNILQQLSQNNELEESIQQVLNLVRQWEQASRVLLYRSKTEQIFESLKDNLPSISEFSALDCNLFGNYGEQYSQGKIVVIEDLARANLPLTLVKKLKQLNTQALSLVPIKNGTQFLGVLSIHSSETFPHWQETAIDRFTDLGRLLALKL